MKHTKLLLLSLLGFGMALQAQRVSNATFLKPSPRNYDVHIPFQYNGEGVATPMEWGLDLAWRDEANVRTGVFYAGQELIDIIRLSFQPTASVENGSFSSSQKTALNYRANAVMNWCKKDVTYNLNSDHESVDNWYKESGVSSAEIGKRWAKLIDMTADYYKSKGLKNLVSISPFNEPDYGWDQGRSNSRKEDMKQTCVSLKNDFEGKYDGVRMSGGNTLNADKAYEWWNYMKTTLDEGNTHQLAGSFDNYANFFERVREYGHHATADELHNVTEAMVGVEYGLQTGIWWGTCEHTRSEFMKATYHRNPGKRLGYGEHRNNWTSAAVYRQADGRVQVFGGTSERQAYTTVYSFTALDQPVWYDGQRGREYTMNIPGGTGYQQGQTGFETVVDVQGGDDVAPHIDGTYKIVNVATNYALTANSSFSNGGWKAITQETINTSNPTNQQWSVTPSTLDGDRAYHIIKVNYDAKNFYIDVKDWNYNSGAETGTYPGGLGTIEQWYLEYAGDNSFYIRSRYSTKCLEPSTGQKTSGDKIVVNDIKNKASQKWRLIPVNVAVNYTAPSAPKELTATPHNASIELNWKALTVKDLKSYTVLRSTDGENYHTLCNELTTNSFTDNEAEDGVTYYYKVYAEDFSLNRGSASAVVQATTTGEPGEVLSLQLDSTFYDKTENANHCIMIGDTVFRAGQSEAEGDYSLVMDGSNNYIQLPYTIANHDEMSISLMCYYRGGSQWQRLLDFGNGTDQYMFLTPNSGTGISFVMKNGGDEQIFKPGKTMRTLKWSHMVVTIGKDKISMYINGEKVGETSDITIRPNDFKPVRNFIGRSQYNADPLLKGYVDNVQIFNYVLSEDEIKNITDGITELREPNTSSTDGVTYDLSGRRTTPEFTGIKVQNGKKILKK